MAQNYEDPIKDAVQSQVGRRSRMETFCDILQVISAGAEKPTHIMYKANLSWVVMNEYIKSLEDRGLVIVSSGQEKRSYQLSSKGFQVLSQFKAIREDLKVPT